MNRIRTLVHAGTEILVLDGGLDPDGYRASTSALVREAAAWRAAR